METPLPVKFIDPLNPGHPILLETFLVRNEHFINTTLNIMGTVIDVMYFINDALFFLHWTFDFISSGDPTIELAVVPSVGRSSSDPQKLLCSATGFDPKIKWLSESREKTGRDLDPTVMEDGRMKAYSEILVPQQEWNQGITYTCQINNGHDGKTAEKRTSICTGKHARCDRNPVVLLSEMK